MTRDNELRHPLEIADGRQAARLASQLQEQVESDLRDRSRELAEAERSYRSALAESILRHKADGVAWTVCGDLARGDKRVAELRMQRDIAEGVLESVKQAAYRRGADRRSLETFLTWSMKVDLRERAEPDWGTVPVIGGRRAA